MNVWQSSGSSTTAKAIFGSSFIILAGCSSGKLFTFIWFSQLKGTNCGSEGLCLFRGNFTLSCFSRECEIKCVGGHWKMCQIQRIILHFSASWIGSELLMLPQWKLLKIYIVYKSFWQVCLKQRISAVKWSLKLPFSLGKEKFGWDTRGIARKSSINSRLLLSAR